MAAKHQLSCFPNVDYLNLELTTKKRIEKDSSKAENGMLFQNLLFGFPPFLVFGGQFWYVEVKKWPTIVCFNLMLGFFWIFWSRFSAKNDEVFWLFFHYIIISVSNLDSCRCGVKK